MKNMRKSFRSAVAAFGIFFLLVPWSLAADHSIEYPRPVPLGISGGNINDVCSAGTLGSLVKKINRDKFFILSNNHVLARENEGVKKELIIQPGTLDSGCVFKKSRKVAKLKKFIPIVFSMVANNEVDAAIAKIIDGKVMENGEILDIGQVSTSPLDPQIGMAVKKAGRTTDLTFGNITTVSATVLISYSSGTARFVNQFIVVPDTGTFSQPGDSGSLIVTDEESCPSPVGLLFAGSATTTIANPIKTVYQKLKIEPVGCSAPADQGASKTEVQSLGAIVQALDVKARFEEELLNMPNVVGVGIGLDGDEVVIKVFLEKMGDSYSQMLNTFREGIRIKPQVTGKFFAF